MASSNVEAHLVLGGRPEISRLLVGCLDLLALVGEFHRRASQGMVGHFLKPNLVRLRCDVFAD